MLKDSFFTILSYAEAENGRTYRIALNGSHPIFRAHFAGNPIMPGACYVQLIKELTSDYFSRTFFTRIVRNMKFLHVINPLESPEISVQLVFSQPEDEHVSVSAVLNDGERVFSKSTFVLENLKD
jgi:3-hydroxyacyl-[acyl-carrier-protein] dehydratase